MNYVEEVDKAYDEFQDVYWDFERLIRTTDRLREPDRQLLLDSPRRAQGPSGAPE